MSGYRRLNIMQYTIKNNSMDLDPEQVINALSRIASKTTDDYTATLLKDLIIGIDGGFYDKV